MKAIVCAQFGSPDGLRFEDVATPLPADEEILVKIYAASINPVDSYTMRGPIFLPRSVARLLNTKGKIPGLDFAGRVEAVGGHVTELQPGDDVFGCMAGGKGSGALAEHGCTGADRIALRPANLSFDEAAALPVAALTALQGLRDKGGIRVGQKVLVDGASGGVGTFAIQIAKAYGAEVTAVCSTRNLETARLLGADHVLDYTREDFTRNGQRYDLIFGANAHHSIFEYRRSLGPEGVFVLAGGTLLGVLVAFLVGPLLFRIGKRKMRFFIAQIHHGDLVALKDLCEAGKLISVIDRRYPLRDAAQAFRYLQEGHAKGKIVLTVEDRDAS